MAGKRRYKILIVDDSAMNRAILFDILEDKFDILEAEDGAEAIELLNNYRSDISLILLDLVMPNMDGFEVLAVMNKNDWIDNIPVIMISSENSPAYIERAYELGVTDFINRPFNVSIVRKRVANTIMLYAKQKNLIDMVNQQIYEKEKHNDIMINILSHIVEFRNGESGLHILHINTITEILLKRLTQITDKYPLNREEIETIVTASSLHDIGKISVPDEILNKPGRLTKEEFEIIKGHSKAGADMLGALVEYRGEPLIKIAHDICLYHHERYDGSGYPVGLKGDEIPISAQVVSIADVYDALVSERCYKKAIPHNEALQMIKNGECGAFNPILLECLDDVAPVLEKELSIKSSSRKNMLQIKKMTDEMLRQSTYSIASNTLNNLERERYRQELFASLSEDLQFEYNIRSGILTISERCADKFGLPQEITNPGTNEKLLSVLCGKETLDLFNEEFRKTSPEDPVSQFTIKVRLNDEFRHHKVHCRVNWSNEEDPSIISAIGKINDIEDEYQKILNLEKSAATDNLTKLYNRGHAEELIKNILQTRQEESFAVLLFDVDDFKNANDSFGHLFGDMVLKSISDTLIRCRKSDNIVARIGGDEFLMFTPYTSEDELNDYVKYIYKSLNSIDCNSYKVHLSLGIAKTDMAGFDYTHLFRCADSALYHSKTLDENRYTFYQKNMELSNMEVTPIEN